MKLNTPTVGPILGYTTHNEARIMLAGASSKITALAVVRYRRTGELKWSTPHFAELPANDDTTGVVVLPHLQSNMKYTYQAGWCIPASSTKPQDIVFEWPAQEHTFWTVSTQPDIKRSYIIGSCRYLNLAAQNPVDPQRGDWMFRIMAEPNLRTDGLIMVGDQIYADDLNFAFPDRKLEDFLRKYRAAFSQPHIKNMMSNTSTYMILDDHEIEDNWPAKRAPNDDELFNNAMKAYQLYQCSHSPAHTLTPDNTINRKLEHYWYQFTNGNLEWFVTDTRTQRNLSPNDRRLMDHTQEKALTDWLKTSSAKVKFIVTSVMFYPDLKNDGGDAWKSFPEQRNRLLEFIRLNKIKNVVFVSGDVHGSMTSRLTHSEDKDFVVHTIVSSPLCNTTLLPYAKKADFILDKPLTTVGTGSYNLTLTSNNVIGTDNFARITIEGKQIAVGFFDNTGKNLQPVTISLV
ncbi:alkaline phosphatase D family protein [Pseudomonas sp. GL-B-26]|uniref:alkaline phosphatase D family protein n=1 Tax=unclassified Pseudomonas TaxID=196821 RepID=UPI001CC01AE4|nr:alkaline phosphatase D family protein [Pseudomonas sp. GL-B-26]